MDKTIDKYEVLKKIKDSTYKVTEKKKAKSDVWKIFAQIEKDDGTVIPNMAYCRKCGVVLKTYSKQTSNLTRHGCYTRPEGGNPTLLKLNTDEKRDFFEVCVQWIIRDCVPYSVVESSGFQSLIENSLKIGMTHGDRVNVLDLIPDSSTLSKRVISMAEEERINIQGHLQQLVEEGRATIAADIWTDSFVKRSFLGVTLHFYEERFHEIVLGVKSMDFNEISGEVIYKKMKNLLLEFNIIDLSKLILVTDCRSDLINAFAGQTRLNCSNHLFNNVLESAFLSSEPLQPFIESCNKLVKFLKKSKFQQVLDTTLKTQCTTRWYSHFQMFISIYDNWKKINEMLVERNELNRISEVRYDLLEPIVDLCDKFDKISRKLQSSKSVSISFVYPAINRLRAICTMNPLDPLDSSEIASLKNNIIENVELLWVPNLNVYHKAAVFFYPPTNNFLDEDDFNEVKLFCLQSENISESCMPQAKKIRLNNTAAELDDADFFFPEIVKKEPEMMTMPETLLETEIHFYKNQKTLLEADFDPILWWKMHSNVYTKLSKIAIRILSIPASSAAVERAFSMAGNILMEKRNRLESKTFDSVLFLNSTFSDDC